MARWFYAQNGQKKGPYSSAQLKLLAESGQLRPTDLIWKEGMAQWVPAFSVKGLFSGISSGRPTAGPPALPQHPPSEAPPATGTPSRGPAAPPLQQLRPVGAVLGLALLLCPCVFCVFCGLLGSPKPEEDRKHMAYLMSQEFVERRLKAPSSAKFPLYEERFVEDLGENRYRVRAYVDAQNSFGAMLRADYTCVVRWVEGTRWTMESLDISGR